MTQVRAVTAWVSGHLETSRASYTVDWLSPANFDKQFEYPDQYFPRLCRVENRRTAVRMNLLVIKLLLRNWKVQC